jgi:predicted PurR-regulated permease PerM
MSAEALVWGIVGIIVALLVVVVIVACVKNKPQHYTLQHYKGGPPPWDSAGVETDWDTGEFD